MKMVITELQSLFLLSVVITSAYIKIYEIKFTASTK